MTIPKTLRAVRTRIAKNLVTLAHLPRLLASLWRTSWRLTVAMMILRFLRALQPPAMLLVGKLIIDEIVLQMATPAPGTTLSDWLESGRATALAGWIGLEFLLVAAGNAMTRAGTLVEALLSERHGHELGIRLVEHAARLDLKDIEGAAAQDRLQRANAATFLGQQLLMTMLGQAQNAVTLVALLLGIVVFVPGLVALLLLALLPTFVVEAHFNARQYQVAMGLIPERRQLNYFQHIGTRTDAAKEVKLFGLDGYLAARVGEAARKIVLANQRIGVRRAAWSSVSGAVGSIAYYAAYTVIAWRTLTGDFSLGDLTFLSGSLIRLNSLFESIVVGLTTIGSQTQYLDDLYGFMAMRPGQNQAAAPKPFPSPLRHGIVFEDVGFRYPGSEDWALRRLSFSLPAGETLALVGENGAGKTTIVKLMTRLYEPDEGRILIDGTDLRDIETTELRRHVGAIFQDFMRYNVTAADNIGIGRVENIGSREAIADAAKKSLADPLIAALPAGYDQMLGRNFTNGIDLSGGEWQKIAIARAYFRDAEILILDEPTAALDARAEAELFERFRSLSQARTALLISHRFSTVRMADRILVLEDGAILESGDHETLMALGGRYAELFALQAAGFQ